MSREIKFRFWDTEEGKWLGKESSYWKELTFEDCRKKLIASMRQGNIVAEQYTGLKDKNGKEIYEGDIVKTTDRVTVKDLIFLIGVVEFKQQAFWICNVPSERPDFTHNETLLQYWETDLEVIGNVHEDKGLLND